MLNMKGLKNENCHFTVSLHLYLYVHELLGLFSALKIHLSRATKVLLEQYPGYSVDERGEIQIKVTVALIF